MKFALVIQVPRVTLHGFTEQFSHFLDSIGAMHHKGFVRNNLSLMFQMYRLTVRSSKDSISEHICSVLAEEF